MAAKGATSKETIIAKLLEVFPGAFQNDKEIRIPMNEGGDEIQIKCTLTCAKTNVPNPNGTTVSGFPKVNAKNSEQESAGVPEKFMNEPTEEEKEKVQTLCEELGLL